MDLKVSTLAVVSLLLCGCAETTLTRQQIAAIPELDVVVGVAQDTLAVQQIDPMPIPLPQPTSTAYQPTPVYRAPPRNKAAARAQRAEANAALGAAIGEAIVALIVVGIALHQERRRADLEARAAPLKQALDGYDFRAELLQTTTDALSKVQSVKVAVQPAVLTESTDAMVRAVHARSTASAVLFFLVTYSFEEGGGGYGLAFRSTALVFPKAAPLMALRRRPNDADPIAEGNAIHLKKVEFFLPYDPQADIRAVLRQGAYGLANQLASDLEPAK